MNRENRLVELIELLLRYFTVERHLGGVGVSYINALNEVLNSQLVIEVGKVYQLTNTAVVKREMNSQIKTESNLVYILSQNSQGKWLANYVSDSNVLILLSVEDLEPIQYEYEI